MGKSMRRKLAWIRKQQELDRIELLKRDSLEYRMQELVSNVLVSMGVEVNSEDDQSGCSVSDLKGTQWNMGDS